eukprot:9208203-Heterocapsa_arctica.AAC.1
MSQQRQVDDVEDLSLFVTHRSNMFSDIVATFVAPFVTQMRNEAKPRVQLGAARWAYAIGLCEKAHIVAHAVPHPLMLH